MVVRRQPGVRESLGLLVGQHAEGDARFHAEVAHPADHVEHLVELRPVLDFAPGGAHAEARRAELLRPGRLLANLLERHERRRLDAGLEASALGTVAAILRAAAGLDAEQDAALDVGRIVMLPMHLSPRGRSASGSGRYADWNSASVFMQRILWFCLWSAAADAAFVSALECGDLTPLLFFVLPATSSAAKTKCKNKSSVGSSLRHQKLRLPFEDEYVIVGPAMGGGDRVPERGDTRLHLSFGDGAGKDE